MPSLRRACLLLHVDQLDSLQRQLGIVHAKGFGNHLQRLGQVLTGIDQISGGLHRLRPANPLQDRGDSIGMHQGVFACVQRLAGNQRLGKRARPAQRLRLVGQAAGRGIDDLRTDGGRMAFHGRIAELSAQQEACNSGQLVGGDNRRRMTHTGKLNQLGFGPALAHGLSGRRAEQVRISTAQ